MKLLDIIKTKRLYLDGGFGSMLIEAGMQAGEIPDLFTLSNPELVRGIHESYLRAGSDIFCANTFGANPIKLPGHDIQALVGESVKLAREAVRNAGGKPRWIALDIGPLGSLLRPLGELSFEDAYRAFAQVVQAGRDADLIIIETMTDLYELKAAVLAAKENSGLPVFATVSVDSKGQLLTGADIPGVVATLEGLRVDALGFNCSLAPHELTRHVTALAECASVPLIVKPNAGLPGMDGSHGHETPEVFASDMAKLARLGVHILGGCCGTTPKHIEQMIGSTKDIPLPKLAPKTGTVIASGCRSVSMDGVPLIIGERLNPTGKKLLKEALREGRMDYLLREAVSQQTRGAHVLDVNVGLPELDEPAVMVRVVEALQGVVQIPLQIDSSDASVLESALRIYNGKAMINSVNGKRDSMESVFPLAAKYGGVLVALTLDENGIPDNAEGRLDIARRIVQTAARYGIAPKDIVVDGLTLSVSANPDEARVTLETIRLIRERLGLHTVLGVSNVSFGLPSRDLVNSAFLTMALDAGLSSAIVNPCSDAIMGAYHAFLALNRMDAGFAAYTARYGGGKQSKPEQSPSAAPELSGLIRDGMSGETAQAARLLLETLQPAQIIDTHIVPALDAVGVDFESGVLFLPQLLRSAEAAQNAFDVLRERMPAAQTSGKPKIVIATVKGDIHDIGKNIAKVLLSNYGYQVIDLGKDVPPEAVVESARQTGAEFVGLSALMTTTVKSMDLTIQALRADGYSGKVMVSGAVMNAQYAEMIGADAYVKDAMDAMRYMESTLQ